MPPCQADQLRVGFANGSTDRGEKDEAVVVTIT